MAQEAFVVEFIKEIRNKDPGIGGGKLWQMYQERFGIDHSVGYNRFYDIIEKYDFKVRKRKRRVITTNSNHGLPIYPNLIKELIAHRPNQIWVSDITYIPFWLDPENNHYEFCYLSLITDIYTKKIVGYCVGETLEAKFTLNALTMALEEMGNKPGNGLIHHSDRGIQYACCLYTDVLKKYGIQISMTESGNPKDNAVAERINNTIKNELLMGVQLYSIDDVRMAIRLAVNFYNKERPHMSLNGLTPYQASNHRGYIPKKWTSYRELAIKNKFCL